MPPTTPSPLLYPPPLAHHTTLIILHGRGSTAQTFAPPLLSSSLSPTSTFHTSLPHTKLVFPTAPLRRAAAFNRSMTHQWFDTWSLSSPTLKPHLGVQGLRETSLYLREFVAQEVRDVGKGRVGIMGLSQGAAAGLVGGLVLCGDLGIGGIVGLAAYLPFREGLEEVVHDDEDEGDGDGLFERDDDEDEGQEKSGFERAVEWLREELEIEEEGGSGMQRIPVFMGHGVEDEKVDVGFGRKAKEFLRDVGVGVTWREYEGLGHWYNADMLNDVVTFLKCLEGWGDIETAKD